MQIVIEIPEDVRNTIIERELQGIMARAIANGKPLPKGHGRLIDADALLISEEECSRISTCIECRMNIETCEHFKAVIKDAPTIIEADKEVRDEKA